MTGQGDPEGPGRGVEGRIEDLDRRQEKTARAIKLLVDKVEELGAILTRLSEGVAARPTGPADQGPASSPDGAELAGWVTWLIGHYELTGIPACWPRHGGLVAEFDALRVAWDEAIGHGPGGMAAVQWHDALGRALARIHDPHRSQWRQCIDFGHKDPPPPPTPDGDPAERMAAAYQSHRAG